MNHYRISRVLPVLLVAFLSLGAFPSFVAPIDVKAQPSIARLQVWNDVYGSNITNLALTLRSQVTVEVNVTGAGPFNGFDVVLRYYNLTIGSPVLDAVGSRASLAGGLFDSSNVPSECTVFELVNDVDVPPGRIRVAAALFGCSVDGTGTLFTVTFDVVSVGAAAIDIVATDNGGKPETQIASSGRSVPYEAFGADFRNKPGIPPIADFSFSPATPLRGDTVNFDGTLSFDPDNLAGPDKGIRRWVWAFGDGTQRLEGSVVNHTFIAPPVIPITGNFSVTLIVHDHDDGLGARKVVIVRISAGLIHDVAVFLVIGAVQVIVGEILGITATVANNGNQDEIANLTVTNNFQGGTVIAKEQLSLTTLNRFKTFQYSLDTQGLPVGIYTITAVAVIVDPVTGGVVIDAMPFDNTRSATFSVIPPIQVDLATDKSQYLPAEPVQIRISVSNIGQAVVTLHFSSTCQASFAVLGTFVLDQICGLTMTELALGPGQKVEYMFTWNQVDFFGRQVPADFYTITGRILSLEPTPVVFAEIEIVPIQVSIDVKPRDEANRINVRSLGPIPVAILTTPAFDAGTVDPRTVRFGRLGIETGPVVAHFEDVDGDRDFDLVLLFRVQDAGFRAGDTQAILRGRTFDGRSIIGSDVIQVFFPGDVNGDLIVDIQDLALVGAAFGSSPGAANWNPYADFDGNGRIDIVDLATVGFYFGQHA